MSQAQNPEGHGRPDYIYRSVGTPQMRFEGVPTLSSLGIVGLDSSMFHPMSPKISEGLLQSERALFASSFVELLIPVVSCCI